MHQVTRGVVWGLIATAALVLIAALDDDPTVEQSAPAVSEGHSPVAPDQPGPETHQTDEKSGPDETADSDAPQPRDSGERTDQPAQSTASALDQLRLLPIKGRAPQTGYDREGQFGPAWLDVDSNGCDTRNDILLRDLDDAVVDDRCRVLTGQLIDPFSGDTIDFQRGESTSVLIQIDHVVPLSNAWQTGAAQLDQSTRLRLANEPLNLIAVQGRLNAQKGDGDAATWLPPRREFWCEYVARQVGVKSHYGLWVTQPEFDRIEKILKGCPGFPALDPQLHGDVRPGEMSAD